MSDWDDAPVGADGVNGTDNRRESPIADIGFYRPNGPDGGGGDFSPNSFLIGRFTAWITNEAGLSASLRL